MTLTVPVSLKVGPPSSPMELLPVLPALVSVPWFSKTPPVVLMKPTLVSSSVNAKLAPGWLSSVPPLSMKRVVEKPPM